MTPYSLRDNEQQAQNLLESLNGESEKRGLTINKKKTKIMVFSKRKETPTSSDKLNNITIEQVESFNYLGSLLTSDCKCDREIRRIALAKKSFMNKKSIITNNVMFFKCFVWSVLLYGCEAWTISKITEKILMAMETLCWKRMLRISWIKITNEKVLELAGNKRSLMEAIRKRQLNFVGHTSRIIMLFVSYYKREWFGKALSRRRN